MTERYQANRRNGVSCKYSFDLSNPLLVKISELRPGVVLKNYMERFYPGRRMEWSDVIEWCTERNIRVKCVYTGILPESVLLENPDARTTTFDLPWVAVRFETPQDAVLFKLSWL